MEKQRRAVEAPCRGRGIITCGGDHRRNRRAQSPPSDVDEIQTPSSGTLFLLTLRTAAGAGAGFFPLGGACTVGGERKRAFLRRKREGWLERERETESRERR